MAPTLPPPPPLPSNTPRSKSVERAPSTVFDKLVASVSVLTLLAIAIYLFPRKPETQVLDSVIRLDVASAAPVAIETVSAAQEAAPKASPSSEAPRAANATNAAVEVTAETDPSAPAPKVGDVYEGLLTGAGGGKETMGLGRVKINDHSIYVRGAKKGETVRFRIVEERRSKSGDSKPYFFAEVEP